MKQTDNYAAGMDDCADEMETALAEHAASAGERETGEGKEMP